MSAIAEESLDFVFSLHCLEHNQNWREILQEWVSKLNGAFLYLARPDRGIWTVGSPFVGTEHKWTPTAQIIKASLKDLACNIVAFDDGPDAMFSFCVCARRSC